MQLRCSLLNTHLKFFMGSIKLAEEVFILKYGSNMMGEIVQVRSVQLKLKIPIYCKTNIAILSVYRGKRYEDALRVIRGRRAGLYEVHGEYSGNRSQTAACKQEEVLPIWYRIKNAMQKKKLSKDFRV